MSVWSLYGECVEPVRLSVWSLYGECVEPVR